MHAIRNFHISYCATQKYVIVILVYMKKQSETPMRLLNKKKKIRSRAILLSMLGAIGVFSLSSLINNQFLIPNLLFVPSLIVCYVFWSKNDISTISKIDTLFSFLLSIVLTFGFQLSRQNHLEFGMRTILSLICPVAAIYPLIQSAKALIKKFFEDKTFTLTKKHKLGIFLLILSVNLLIWIILFPGIYTYDMASWNEIFSRGTVTSHWSITYGLFLALFLDIGKALFNNYSIGFSIAMLIQSILVSYVYYRIIAFVAEKVRNKNATILSIIFFIANPFLVIMSITDAQDVLFGCLFSIILLEIYEALTHKDYFAKKIRFVSLSLLTILMITVRNNGVYCLILMIPFLAVFKKIHNKRQIIAITVISILFSFIYTGPFFSSLNISKTTTINEILSVPSQQLAKSFYENPDSFTGQDLAELGSFYDLNGEFNLYQKYPLIADYTKGSLNSEYTSEHLGQYVSLYIRVGLKNPRKYVEAFILNSIGFWMPGKSYDDSRINMEYMNYPGFSMTSAYLDPTHDAMKEVTRANNNLFTKIFDNIIFGNGWYKLPFISLISSMGWYWLILLYLTIRSIKNKNGATLAAVSPAIGLFLTLLLAPVAIYRYIYPIAILVPVFCSLIGFSSNPQKPKRQSHKMEKIPS